MTAHAFGRFKAFISVSSFEWENMDVPKEETSIEEHVFNRKLAVTRPGHATVALTASSNSPSHDKGKAFAISGSGSDAPTAVKIDLEPRKPRLGPKDRHETMTGTGMSRVCRVLPKRAPNIVLRVVIVSLLEKEMADRDFSLSANVAGLKAVGKLEDALTEAWYSTAFKYKLMGSGTAMKV